jgi:hypothetical protein
MKTYRGVEHIYNILDLGTRWKLHATAALSSTDHSPAPIWQETGWTPSRSTGYTEDKNVAPAWNRTPVVQPAHLATELSQHWNA